MIKLNLKSVKGLFFPTYVTQPELLDGYEYHAGKYTKLDNFLNDNFWTPLSYYIPLWVHPNTLTVAALWCSIVVTLLPFYLCHLAGYAPGRLVYAFAAIGFFLYQTLDVFDGKQARRLQLSSPIGQMFDHGCDAITTHASAFIVVNVLDLPIGFAIGASMLLLLFQLFYYSWFEYKTGVFKGSTDDLHGVTEAQFFVILLCLFTAVFPSFWSMTAGGVLKCLFIPLPLPLYSLFVRISCWMVDLATLRLPMKYFGGLLTAHLMGSVVVTQVRDAVTVDYALIVENARQQAASKANEPLTDVAIAFVDTVTSKQCYYEWSLLGLHIFCAVVFCNTVLSDYPLLGFIILSTYGPMVAWKLILAAMIQVDLSLVDTHYLIFVIGCVMAPALPPFGRTVFMFGWAIAGLVGASWFIYNNLNIMLNYLGISLFRVGQDKIEACIKREAAAKAPSRSSLSVPADENDDGIKVKYTDMMELGRTKMDDVVNVVRSMVSSEHQSLASDDEEDVSPVAEAEVVVPQSEENVDQSLPVSDANIEEPSPVAEAEVVVPQSQENVNQSLPVSDANIEEPSPVAEAEVVVPQSQENVDQSLPVSDANIEEPSPVSQGTLDSAESPKSVPENSDIPVVIEKVENEAQEDAN